MTWFARAAASMLAALAGMAWMGATAAPAAPVGDSVTAIGTSTVCGGPLEIFVQSGPSGENPTGQVSGACRISGPITCLDVRTTDGPGAGFHELAVVGATGPGGPILLIVLSSNVFGSGVGVVAGSDCTQTLGSSPFDLGFSGSIDIVDAPPLPTATRQCKDGGWRSYGIFENQGDCVSFVASGGRNRPGLELVAAAPDPELEAANHVVRLQPPVA